MLNKIVIMGRCTKDPELRATQNGTSVCTVNVAVDRDFARDGASDKTDYFTVVAWRQTGEFLSKYFTKGSLVVVVGAMQSRKWEDKNGNKRTDWEINAEHIYFGGSKKDNNDSSFQPPQAQNVSAADFEDLEDDAGGELPFYLG